MKKLNKLGFTIVELVIVIAIVSVLAAVNIPIFSGLIEKANQSVDVQLVKHMNTMLAAEGAVEKNTIFDVHEALADMGCDPEDYQPLTKDTYFFWDKDEDRIIQIDKNMTVIAPEEYAGTTYNEAEHNWLALTMKFVNPSVVTPTTDGDKITYNVKTAAELAWVINQINTECMVYEGGKAVGLELEKNVEILLEPGTYNMMGADISFAQFHCVNDTLVYKGNHVKRTIYFGSTNKNSNDDVKIINTSSMDIGQYGDGVTDGHDGQYFASGLFKFIGRQMTVTIKNVTFENMYVKNSHASNVAFLVGSTKGNLTIENVRIYNSEVIGHRGVGSLIGQVHENTVTIQQVALSGVNVKTVGGRGGILIGHYVAKNTIDVPMECDSAPTINSISLANCSYSLYECEQNTGVWEMSGENEGNPLGLQADGKTVFSWAYDGEGNKEWQNDKYFVEGALATHRDGKQASKVFEGKVTVMSGYKDWQGK